MKHAKWNYKIGGNLHGLIPSLFLLALFGGLSIWLYLTQNSAFVLSLIFTAFVVVILLAIFYSALFVKVYIYEEGFYHQTRPGNGKYYQYSEIKEAWVSSGKATVGVNNYFCNYKTLDGQVVKFPFLPYETDGVEHLVACVQSKAQGTYSDPTNKDSEEYLIDGKVYGVTYIIISLVIFAIFSLTMIPMFLREVSAGRWFGAFFSATGFLLPLSIVIKLVIRYFFHKVKIEKNRFYLQTNPFNGKYYAYADIKNCKEVLKVARHGRYSGRSSRAYFYFFIFTDMANRTRKFQFQKDIHGHEIDVLKKRISLYSPCEVGEDENNGSSTAVKTTVRIVVFLLVAALMVFLGFLSKQAAQPSSTPSQSKGDTTQTAGAPAFSDVHSVLSERGFETANIPTTYWFIEESKLANVVSGRKGDMAFEFYEYADSETVDLIFNQISYDISKDIEIDEREKQIVELSDGSKMFTLTQNGVFSIVVYKEDTLVYAHSPETSTEIEDILMELGYIKKD